MRTDLKKRAKTRKIIVGFLAVVLILVFLNIFNKEVRSFFYCVSSPLQRVFWRWGDGSSDFFVGFIKRGEIEKEKENLKKENQKLMSEIIYLESVKEENKVLREALDLDLKKEFNLSVVQIIAKDLSENTVLIDKGSESGLSPDMPVLTSEKILAGKISEVYDNFSKVTLLSHEKSKFGAKIKGKDITGVAKGEGGALLLDFIPKDKEISIGDSVVTAGLEKSFPPNLLVGRVSGVEKEDVESVQKAFIEMSFNLDRNPYLFVIKNF